MNIEAITTAALSGALDIASRRQSAIAANIANANTEGFAPVRLSFEAQLSEARETLRQAGRLDAAALEGFRSDGESVVASPASGQGVQLDLEMAEMARNSVEFQALTQGLARHLGLLALAAADGRK
jgi:flagellar basal-body rod protein FlgB